MDISELTISELKSIIAEQDEAPDISLLQAMSKDSRVGVRKLYEQLAARRQKYENEKLRLSRLYEHEVKYTADGYRLIAGVDEAGRGPLAGPVVAAAVILPERAYLPGLNDSKKLSKSSRESLFIKIKSVALSWAVETASVEEILKLNIFQASLLAMRRAVYALEQQSNFVLVDGVKILDLPCPQKSLVKGDTISASIAAASVLAKVTRDSMMLDYHNLYPQYGFDRHKGYPTGEHLRALARYGPSPIHRADFKPVKESYDIIKNN